MEVVVLPTYEEMSRAAAADVADVLNTKPNAVLGMATGSTPLGLVPGAGPDAPRGGARLLPGDDVQPGRVRGPAAEPSAELPLLHARELLQACEHRPSRTSTFPRARRATTRRSAQWYEQRIKECGGIDLQILGIGSDGHIAFNEPGSSLTSRTRLKTLAKQTIDDNARFFEQPRGRADLRDHDGRGHDSRGPQTAALANGKNKAAVARRWSKGPSRR